MGDAIIGRRADVVLSEQFNFYSKEVSRPETGIIRKFASLEDAQAWAEQDPYVVGDVYKSVMVKPFKRVLP